MEDQCMTFENFVNTLNNNIIDITKFKIKYPSDIVNVKAQAGGSPANPLSICIESSPPATTLTALNTFLSTVATKLKLKEQKNIKEYAKLALVTRVFYDEFKDIINFINNTTGSTKLITNTLDRSQNLVEIEFSVSKQSDKVDILYENGKYIIKYQNIIYNISDLGKISLEYLKIADNFNVKFTFADEDGNMEFGYISFNKNEGKLNFKKAKLTAANANTINYRRFSKRLKYVLESLIALQEKEGSGEGGAKKRISKVIKEKYGLPLRCNYQQAVQLLNTNYTKDRLINVGKHKTTLQKMKKIDLIHYILGSVHN